MRLSVLIATACTGAILLGGCFGKSLEGTYQFTHRELPDGTTVHPPVIRGMWTYVDGKRNFNVFWIEDGVERSVSMISEYSINEDEYHETSLSYVNNDGIDDHPLFYDMAGSSGTSEVTRTEGRVEFQLPLYNEPFVVFTKHGFTATRDGAFVDHWEKVR